MYDGDLRCCVMGWDIDCYSTPGGKVNVTVGAMTKRSKFRCWRLSMYTAPSPPWLTTVQGMTVIVNEKLKPRRDLELEELFNAWICRWMDEYPKVVTAEGES